MFCLPKKNFRLFFKISVTDDRDTCVPFQFHPYKKTQNDCRVLRPNGNVNLIIKEPAYEKSEFYYEQRPRYKPGKISNFGKKLPLTTIEHRCPINISQTRAVTSMGPNLLFQFTLKQPVSQKSAISVEQKPYRRQRVMKKTDYTVHSNLSTVHCNILLTF